MLVLPIQNITAFPSTIKKLEFHASSVIKTNQRVPTIFVIVSTLALMFNEPGNIKAVLEKLKTFDLLKADILSYLLDMHLINLIISPKGDINVTFTDEISRMDWYWK